MLNVYMFKKIINGTNKINYFHNRILNHTVKISSHGSSVSIETRLCTE